MSIGPPRFLDAQASERGRELRSGARWGLKFAAYLSLWVVVMLAVVSAGVLMGVLPEGSTPLRDVWLPLPLILAVYFIGGAAGGGMWAMTRPLRRRSVAGWILAGMATAGATAGIVGVLGASLFTLSLALVADPRPIAGPWILAAIIFAASTLLVGPCIGLGLWVRAWSRYDLPGQEL